MHARKVDHNNTTIPKDATYHYNPYQTSRKELAELKKRIDGFFKKGHLAFGPMSRYMEHSQCSCLQVLVRAICILEHLRLGAYGHGKDVLGSKTLRA